MTPDLHLLASWQDYEAGNRRANDAYYRRVPLVCRRGCPRGFPTSKARALHERACGVAAARSCGGRVTAEIRAGGAG